MIQSFNASGGFGGRFFNLTKTESCQGWSQVQQSWWCRGGKGNINSSLSLNKKILIIL
jgi:hypothetical protein